MCISCPAPGSDLLYRGNVVQSSDGTTERTEIPFRAFKFVGTFDQVSFTCIIKLCTLAEAAANDTVCRKVD